MRSVLAAAVAAAALSIVPATAAEAAMEARGSARQVYATGLEPGTKVTLSSAAGKTIKSKAANELGGVLFRGVKPGDGYRLKAAGEQSGELKVLSDQSAPPSTDVYEQNIPADGYGYLTTRDGTKLAYSVHPPSDVSGALGLQLPELPASPPYPTLIEYAGYGYARPSGPESGISLIANLMGFAVVDVNMRGTGCSGGAFDFFEPLQNLDGYDVIEAVARQPWVANGKVGMFGISYGGISQLFTAATKPPSLAAITPLSVLDQAQTTLYPGGILNTGFAFNWAKERALEARPAGPKAGQEWAYERIQEGDEVCKANQALHAEAPDLIGKVRRNSTYKPKVADPLSPTTFVDEINVPTFMACQHTDEQTGGHCPTLASRLTGTDKKWVTFTNGVHVDSLDPETLNRLFDFLTLYVAKRVPGQNNTVIRATAPLIYEEAMGISGVQLPPDPIQDEPTYASALAAFEALKPVRVLFDNGAGSDPGHPFPGYEKSFDSFPVPGTKARSWYLGPKGSLTEKFGRPGADAFAWNAKARPLDDLKGGSGADEGGVWTASPDYEWTQDPKGTAASYLTAPLTEDVTVMGSGGVTAWVRSSKPSVDLQATISEVRPDGKETFVQGGWLRGEMRKLDRRKSTRTEPVLSLRKRDIAPMPTDRFVKLTIPLYYETHAYRKGSRIRVRITAPNGDQPIWAFKETLPRGKGKADVAIAYGRGKPSRLLLPVVPGLDAPTDLPPCPGLRGEPCRDYVPYENTPAKR
jgi:uncharacterized protein